jgi:hypothetical protein
VAGWQAAPRRARESAGGTTPRHEAARELGLMPAWGHQGELLVAGSSATASSRVATFQCDESLRIAAITGTITELLECDASELSEHQWYPFLHASD